MKKIFISIVILSLFAANTFAQFGKNEEFRYFSIKAGITNSFLDRQPDSLGNKFLNSPYGDMQLVPDKSYIGYTPGFYAGLMYNYDLQSGNIGMVFGANVNNYGMSSRYHTLYTSYWLIEKQNVTNVSVPFYLKFGNDYYERQFYAYIGGSYDMNLAVSQTEEVGWQTEVLRTELDKNVLVRNNFTGLLGVNYMFLNLELDYVFGGFLNKDYEIQLYDGQKSFYPYSGFPSSVIYLKAGIVVPLNSWTPRKIYSIEQWFRRVFK